MVDIVQRDDGTLRLSYRGQRLDHRSYALHDPLPHRRPADPKTLDARVNKARDAEHSRLRRLAAELAFQDAQRSRGVFTPDTAPIVPPRTRERHHRSAPAAS